MDETKHILVYSDSLTWGIIPGTRQRLPFDSRWPGVMHKGLNVDGERIRVTEDCLNGRRTVFDDPYKPGRNALAGIHQVIEAQSPLDCVILLLGTNDFQSMHSHNAWHSATGLVAVVNAVRTAPIEPGMPVPPILLVAPPQLDNPRGPIGPKFSGGDVASRGLADAIRQVSVDTGCAFFDANAVTTSSTVDGVHLDANQHETLGRALTPVVAELLRSA
ncbi:lysophospholipase L1-like esterase [Rhodoglobus vestalii]|uniref:Lysophospholipase L1-like esterase n=1 Tax=Rhodoglobus vestalii TaxID=193384 RepID=A0A8H2K4I6_9MICO|nr:SGNH/GDSL hydrolase family protein [Rhodoglobus vestalii]TQO18824.1 lysophospholipase L1-like esterase [Rhodoglobus vestalii]